MADKKLITYECLLSFSFQAKEDDFMNSDLNFDCISLLIDISSGASICLSGDTSSEHPFIVADMKNVYFSCSHPSKHDIPAKNFLDAICVHEGLESLGDCVFEYQPVIGPNFFLGVKEKEGLLNGLQKKNEKKLESDELPKRSRRKKS